MMVGTLLIYLCAILYCSIELDNEEPLHGTSNYDCLIPPYTSDWLINSSLLYNWPLLVTYTNYSLVIIILILQDCFLDGMITNLLLY